MASFVKQLEELLTAAQESGVVERSSTDALLALAHEREKGRGILNLAAVLSWLGGGVAFVGLLLLISANWSGISDVTKIGGLLVLIAGSHGLGLWIRWTGRPYDKTAEALHFVGAGLFLGGIGLIAQIYHLRGNPPDGLLLWFVAIAPLAYLVRSPMVTLLAIFALLLWAHVAGSHSGSALFMPTSPAAHLMLEIGVGAALVGSSALLRESEPEVAKAMRGSGAVLLFASLYVLSFYRHLSDLETGGSVVLPVAALILGAVALAFGGRKLVPGHPWLRHRLLVLLGLALLLSALALAADTGGLPRGPRLDFFNFGSTRSFDLVEWLLSAGAWVLWFFLALWCVGFGAQSGRKPYLNAGVLGVGVMVITLFFDLIGSLATTGSIFLSGGVVLLGTGWAVERWRRSIVRRMGEGA